MFVYVMINIKKLVLSENDDLSRSDFLLRHEELQEMNVPWKDLKFMLTPSIKRIRHNDNGTPFKLNEESQKYVEAVFSIHETWIDD